MTIRFGFEAEFASRASELTSLLYDRGWTGTPELHNWHCDCEYCGAIFEDGYRPPIVFRGQRDSSVNGEIISQVFTEEQWESAVNAMEALACAAGDSDGEEPGVRAGLSSRCGFHVHVSDTEIEWMAPQRQQMTMAFLGIERHISGVLGAGMYSAKRDANVTLIGATARWVQNYMYLPTSRYPSDYIAALTGPKMYGEDNSMPTTAYERHPTISDQYRIRRDRTLVMALESDRHADLSFSQHHDTAEVRVFNGTRMAWRMEMNCRFAVWLLRRSGELARRCRNEYPDWDTICLHLPGRGTNANITVDPVMEWDELVERVTEDDSRLAELMVRQYEYLEGRSSRLPLGLERSVDA